jgi:hypothetical protein
MAACWFFDKPVVWGLWGILFGCYLREYGCEKHINKIPLSFSSGCSHSTWLKLLRLVENVISVTAGCFCTAGQHLLRQIERQILVRQASIASADSDRLFHFHPQCDNPEFPTQGIGTLLHAWECRRHSGKACRKTLSSILNGHSGISAEMAIRLLIAFNTTAESRLLQHLQYDLAQVEPKRKSFQVKNFAAA